MELSTWKPIKASSQLEKLMLKVVLNLVLLMAICSNRANAQETMYNPRSFEVQLTMVNGFKLKGLLWTVTQDSVYVKASAKKFWRDPQYPLEINGFSVSQIQEISIKRNYSLSKNYLTGYYSGVSLGILLSAIQPYPSGFTVIFAGLIGSTLGVLSAGLSGRKLLVLGNADNFKNHFLLLNQHAVLVKVAKPMAMK